MTRTLRSFAPWFAYGIISSFAGWQVAAPVALALAVVVVIAGRRAGEESDVLALATACCFAGVAAVAAIDPSSSVHRYVPALALATLGLAAIASIAVGRPFTEPYAKRQVDPALWSTPRFRQANVTITGVWAASFLTTAAATALLLTSAPHATGLLATVQLLGVAIPFRFTSIYRARLRAQRAALVA